MIEASATEMRGSPAAGERHGQGAVGAHVELRVAGESRPTWVDHHAGQVLDVEVKRLRRIRVWSLAPGLGPLDVGHRDIVSARQDPATGLRRAGGRAAMPERGRAGIHLPQWRTSSVSPAHERPSVQPFTPGSGLPYFCG